MDKTDGYLKRLMVTREECSKHIEELESLRDTGIMKNFNDGRSIHEMIKSEQSKIDNLDHVIRSLKQG